MHGAGSLQQLHVSTDYPHECTWGCKVYIHSQTVRLLHPRPTLSPTLVVAASYAACRHHSKSHSFLGFIDIDEFLVLMDPGIVSVEQLLRPYSGFGGLAVHWQLVGSSNHTARPAGPVTTR